MRKAKLEPQTTPRIELKEYTKTREEKAAELYWKMRVAIREGRNEARTLVNHIAKNRDFS